MLANMYTRTRIVDLEITDGTRAQQSRTRPMAIPKLMDSEHSDVSSPSSQLRVCVTKMRNLESVDWAPYIISYNRSLLICCALISLPQCPASSGTATLFREHKTNIGKDGHSRTSVNIIEAGVRNPGVCLN